jgi:hypothetical protein
MGKDILKNVGLNSCYCFILGPFISTMAAMNSCNYFTIPFIAFIQLDDTMNYLVDEIEF